MSERAKKAKEIIEQSKTEEELLNNLDTFNRPMTGEELSFVGGGTYICKGDPGYCKLDACGSVADGPCASIAANPALVCGKHSEECGSGAQNECSDTDYSMCSGSSERTCASLARGICISPGW